MGKEKIGQTDTSNQYEDNEVDLMMKDCEKQLEDIDGEGKLIR